MRDDGILEIGGASAAIEDTRNAASTSARGIRGNGRVDERQCVCTSVVRDASYAIDKLL